MNWDLITEESLRSLDLEARIAAADSKEYYAFASELAPLERSPEGLSAAQQEALRFVCAVLGMYLKPENASSPFGPQFEMDGRRSAIPDDFPREFLRGLAPWAQSLSDPELKARFCDVVWVQGKDHRSALVAIDAYLAED